MISLFVRIALLALWLVLSQSLVGLQQTSFQDHPPLERFQPVDPLLISRFFSAGTWTKWNSSDDPRKESVSKQGCYLKKKYHSSILITRCLAIWTFQCLHLVLTPPYHLPLVTFAFFFGDGRVHVSPFRWSPSWPIRASTFWRISSFWWKFFSISQFYWRAQMG